MDNIEEKLASFKIKECRTAAGLYTEIDSKIPDIFEVCFLVRISDLHVGVNICHATFLYFGISTVHPRKKETHKSN